MSESKPGKQVQSLFRQACSSSPDMDIVVIKLNEIIKQTNKNTESIERLYQILAGK